MNRASVIEEIQGKAGNLWGTMRGEGGVRKSIHHSWLVKGLGLELLCWGFKGVQEEIPSEEASTLQIGQVAFLLGQYTSPHIHTCHRLFDQDGHQDCSSPFLLSRPCSPVTFGYSLSTEAVFMRQLTWKRSLTRSQKRSLTRSHKRSSIEPSRSCWNGTTSAFQPEVITSRGTRVLCVYYQ